MSVALPQDVAATIVDPKAYAADAPIQEAFAWARRNLPLGLAQPEGYAPFWVVTKHADILDISRNNALFHNGDRETTVTDLKGSASIRQMTGGSPHLIRALVSMDAPEHPQYRMMTQSWFMPANLKKLEQPIRAMARKAIDGLQARGGACEFVGDVALGYPLHVIMEILGVPEADEPLMLKLTQDVFNARDPEQTGGAATDSAARVAHVRAVVAEISRYFMTLIDDRRAKPTDDLASTIANARVDGELISYADAINYYILVATAGHDTTSSSTSGAIWALCEQPEQFAKVKADRSLIPGLVDEAIRWTTPVKHFMRTATEDTEIRGQAISKGDWLMLCYLSGNRDEEVFDDPTAFRVDRKPNKQLAFGYGAHLCLGQHLAKMEMRIFFEEFFDRVASVQLSGTPERTVANFVSGPKRLPITCTFD